MTKIGVLADDLTGAMDAGMQLMKKGYSVCVTADINKIDSLDSDTQVLIVDTESRNIPPNEALEKVKASAQALIDAGFDIAYKKVDSTLRGNIGAELDAVSFNDTIVLFAPALPFNKRATVNGIHYVDGKKLEETELSKDPFSPIYKSFIPDIIADQSDLKTAVIDIETVRAGKKALSQKIEEASLNGAAILVVDAIDSGDLITIAGAVNNISKKVLLCGSAGLFSYLDSITAYKMEEEGKTRRLPYRKSNSPIVVLSGSPAKMSKEQIKTAIENDSNNIEVIRIDREKIFSHDENIRNQEYNRLESVIDEVVATKKDIVVDAAGEAKEKILDLTKNDPDRRNWESSQVQYTLSHIGRYILSKTKVRGLVLFGGDTALTISRDLSASGIEIIREVEPYIPAGLLIGGDADSLPVITKAGGFGNPKSLINIINFLK